MTMMGINKQGMKATITGTVHHLVDFRGTDKPPVTLQLKNSSPEVFTYLQAINGKTSYRRKKI
jgi:hypothetical protein